MVSCDTMDPNRKMYAILSMHPPRWSQAKYTLVVITTAAIAMT
jgi:hypothetical protein